MSNLKVISLEASNILRLKAVQIVPDPSSNTVILGGDNAQGKSSVLACIEMAIGGAKRIPPEPVRRGEKSGAIRLDLGDIIVERTGEKLDKLIVRNADGAPQKSPQALLDKLKSDLSFDPLAFERMDDAKQVELLRKLLGLDFAKLDADIAKAREKRTEVGRSLKASQQRVADFPIACANAPDAEVSIGQLLQEKEAIDNWNARCSRVRQDLVKAQQDEAELERRLATVRQRVQALTTEIADLVEKDVATIATQLTTVEDTNRMVRAKKSRAEESARCDQLEKDYADLTTGIERNEAEKVAAIAAAPWPVAGLGFDATCVTYQGLPFKQASAAQRREIAFEIACALHPDFGVILLPDASLLDKKAMKHIAELAAKHDMQVWIERVGDGDPGAIIIEDGGVQVISDEA